MSIAKYAVEKQKFTAFTTAVLLVAGLASFFQLGQLEDPEFTVKTAVVTTSYLGASAEEVELEVTDRIELALQELSPGQVLGVALSPRVFADQRRDLA